jgi:hypothetical protein
MDVSAGQIPFWYPSVTLDRQHHSGDFRAVIQRVKEELKNFF